MKADDLEQFNNDFFKDVYKIIFVVVCSLIIIISVSYIIIHSMNNKGISKSEFNSIQIGMSYEDVSNIIGEQGELLSSVDLGIGNEYATQIYIWYGYNGISNANITFQDGKVVLKAQFGL
jgi:hypothetical protein